MASDWIKVEKATARKPEVLRLADLLSIHPDHAFGMCVRFWFWCDDQMDAGRAPSVTNATLDSVIGHAGFSSALITVGWLQVRNGSLAIPNFDRHLSESSKKRGLSGKRKQKERAKDVTPVSRSARDKSATRYTLFYSDLSLNSPEKDESESSEKIEVPVELSTLRFREAWFSWETYRKQKGNALTPSTVSRQVAKLAKLGESKAVSAIERSIEMGWTGLFSPDDKPNGTSDAVKARTKSAMVFESGETT